MIDREWIQVEGRIPDNNRVVRIRGILMADATWDKEKNQWSLADTSNMQCNVIDWQEVPPPVIEPIPEIPEVLQAE